MNKKIIPLLHYKQNPNEALKFYVRLFNDSALNQTITLDQSSIKQISIFDFTLAGSNFKGIISSEQSSPTVSFIVFFNSKAEAEILWNKLKEGSTILQPYEMDQFKQVYASLEDKFGITWVIVTSRKEIKQRILPIVMLSEETEEAMEFYKEAFTVVKKDIIQRFKNPLPPYSHLQFEDFELAVIEHDEKSESNNGVSLILNCQDQNELDFYWTHLSKDSRVKHAGSIEDRFGLSWYVLPTALHTMLKDGSKNQKDITAQAFLNMKKPIIEKLEEVYKESE